MVISTEIIQSVMIPLLVAFAISVALSPFVIPFLRRLKVGQTERVEGVQSHLKKAGTPTMGGTIILISVLVTCLFFVGRYPRIIPVLFLTLGFGIIGFLDDYLKVVLKRSDGLLPKQKLFCQLAVTTVFVVYLIFKDESGLTMVLPFTDYVLDIKWITVPLAYFAIHGYRQRCQLYRRSGRPGFQRDSCGSCFLHDRFPGAGRRHRACDRSCGRRTFGLPAL